VLQVENVEKSRIVKRLAGRDIWDQLNQLQEECAELVVAINHHRRAKNGETMAAIIEEIADVSIMIEQAAIFLDAKNKIDVVISQKLIRADERAKNGRL
jgi:NTP pyrophosphatase (non-canonical NTP hydrolase)